MNQINLKSLSSTDAALFQLETSLLKENNILLSHTSGCVI